MKIVAINRRVKMAILKCKMCGGELNVVRGEKVAECEFCGTKQTIPTGNDEKKTNLFNRANRLRIAGEFDKAAGIYESITAEFPDDAESYWGLCLCKFGIEYVDDPKTARKIPTCHRTSFESIFDDENYKSAIEKSDVIAQDIYKNEATEIDRLQKDILSVVHNEEPFDVFICYKETDDLGERTQDSVLAQDIYTELTNQGLKVFFARITLEDKLGKEYEPYIFAALNSAKVMLAIGTKEEYFNSVWVKNEWSRYLALMQADKSKVLIPCYRDMDAYDIPQEFKNLQGQDMAKLGFLQDLVRGVCKIVNPEQDSKHENETPAQTSANATVDSLLKRVFMFLEDGNWNSADEYCEKVLDIDPENAEAYLGKFLVELKCHNVSKIDVAPFCTVINCNNKLQLVKCVREITRKSLEDAKKLVDNMPFTIQVPQNYMDKLQKICEISTSLSSANYKRFTKFASKERVDEVKAYVCENVYRNAVKSMEEKTQQSLESAICMLEEIGEFKDAKELVRLCNEELAMSKNRLPKMQKEHQTVGITISAGLFHIVGLKSDGTVVACKYNRDGQCEVADWRNIVAISAGNDHTVGLKSDGTVLACGDSYYEPCNVEDWRNIVAVSAGWYYTIGLKSDGTVLACGDNEYGQCEITDWKNIIAISAGVYHTVGLKSDGTVVACGNNGCGQCEVADWNNIITISAGRNHTVGLKSDGTVLACGDNKDGLCEVAGWNNIVAISASSDYTVGLKSDGTVLACGDNKDGLCEVAGWKNIYIPERFASIEDYIENRNTEFKKIEKEREEIQRKQAAAEAKRKAAEEKRLAEIKAANEAKRLERERQEQIAKAEWERKKAEYRSVGVCQHCGGTFKGLFSKTCTKCGKRKDY